MKLLSDRPIPWKLMGTLVARQCPLSKPDAAQALLDDLGARIAAERKRHGIPDPLPDLSRFMAQIRRDVALLAETTATPPLYYRCRCGKQHCGDLL